MTYRHCNRTCMESHREDRKRGVCDFGAGEALAAFRFCSYCGTYAPSQNERAVNVPGLPVWFTPEGEAEPVAGFLVRAIIGPTGAMLADVQLNDGRDLARQMVAGRTTDRTAEHLAGAST
jgi:hypothetical protein